MLGTIITGTALALSAGLNGLAIWFVKDYERMMEENEMLHNASIDQGEHIEELLAENKNLKAKITPWNKGKSGYKHKPRVKKYTTFENISDVIQSEKYQRYTSESTL